MIYEGCGTNIKGYDIYGHSNETAKPSPCVGSESCSSNVVFILQLRGDLN